MRRLLLLPLLLLLPACDLLDLGGAWPGLEGDTGWADSGLPEVDFDGFIGAACDVDRDCDRGLTCLPAADGYPGGTCSQPCDRLCPDDDAAPMTFCVTAADLPAATGVGDGACLSRCDFGAFPQTGCRPDYGCVETARPHAGDGDATFACLPDRPAALSGCHDALAGRDVPFEPTVRPTERPAGERGLTCEIDDPVWILGELEGVALADPSGSPTPRVLTSCEAALALADTARDLSAQGVHTIRHWGSYACRTISGTRTLSQHAHGDAFDLTGFELRGGEVVTLVDHWEHDTARPRTEAGALLYDAAHRWHRRGLWNVILTPNYNLAHDDHFHVDLTPGGDLLGVQGGRYLGPAPYVD